MKGTLHTTRRSFAMLGLAATFAGVAISAASAGASYTPSIVASRLGSPDPRDAAAVSHRGTEIGSESYSGDFMFRDLLRGTHWTNARAARYASSGKVGVTAGLVASRLGSPDPRDTARRPQ